ncbi:MAG: HDIG domain-containing protein [Bacteroidetes bacterium]|nr:HDIG domain-containing protein [Bacteroidota bacterium]
MPSYKESLELFHEWTQTDSLRKHGYAVEAAMAFYAKSFGENEETWRTAGLLHDIDYERHQSLDEHPYVGVQMLREKGYGEDVLEAIMGHGNHTNTPRVSKLAKTLFAVDELAGFIMAVAYVRPTRLEGMMANSVTKKLKDKAFAAAVSREDIRNGAENLGLDLNQHIANVITGMQANATRLGFSSSE